MKNVIIKEAIFLNIKNIEIPKLLCYVYCLKSTHILCLVSPVVGILHKGIFMQITCLVFEISKLSWFLWDMTIFIISIFLLIRLCFGVAMHTRAQQTTKTSKTRWTISCRQIKHNCMCQRKSTDSERQSKIICDNEHQKTPGDSHKARQIQQLSVIDNNLFLSWLNSVMKNVFMARSIHFLVRTWRLLSLPRSTQ